MKKSKNKVDKTVKVEANLKVKNQAIDNLQLTINKHFK